MEDLPLIIFAAIFGLIFFGPHTKAKDKKDDKKGGDKDGNK